MKLPFLTCVAGPLGAPLLSLFLTGLGQAQTALFWEAFNDYAPTPGITSDFATGYELRLTDSGGPLLNIATGETLAASVLVLVEGADPDAFGANTAVNPGSPADLLFNGKVDIGNDGLPGIRAGNKLILNFSGLNASRRYNFRGTVSRGGGYNDRWSVFTLSGASAFVAAHVDGSLNKNIITETTFPAAAADLEPNQVALNSGENKVGSLVGWNAIEPAADGTFAIEAQQYVGMTPFGTSANAPYGYGFSAIYLAEAEATGTLRITENPASQRVPAGRAATLRVAASSTSAITYQWQKAPPGSSVFSPIAGATQATYVTPLLVVADDGAKFRCRVSSGANQATSTEATLNVDGLLPTLAEARGSINSNAMYLTFSEAMNLVTLGQANRYQLTGGLTILSVVVLDPTQVRVLTSAQVPGQKYTVTISLVEDVAGNQIAANTTSQITAFEVRSGAVGLEIWDNMLGSLVSDLRGNARYPDEPDRDYSTTSFDSLPVIPDGPLNTYGGRFRAWLTPQVAGDYEFFLRADDTGELWVGLDDDFSTIESAGAPIATDATVGDSFQEPGVDASTSLPIPLLAGQRYAMQALWKEANGGDHCQVAWRRVGDPTAAADLQPIPSELLSYYGPSTGGGPPRITQLTVSGGKVIIGWTGGILRSSIDLKTWGPVPGATSPLTITPGQNTFYRVGP